MNYEENNKQMGINLAEERKDAVLNLFKDFYFEEFDEELSEYRAERILDFFIQKLVPQVYNQAIQDARGFMMKKLDDLDVEFYIDETL